MKCKKCGIEFENTHGNAKYCSLLCRNYFHILKFDKNCKFCKKIFTGRANQKFCSQSCSAKNRTDHLFKIHEAKRKYPQIEGLNRCQIFRKFNPEKGREELAKDNLKRGILIQFLGGKCINCGYMEDMRALNIDHINGDGKIDRKTIGSKIQRYYINHLEECKDKLQVLCCNCHSIKTHIQNEWSKLRK